MGEGGWNKCPKQVNYKLYVILLYKYNDYS